MTAMGPIVFTGSYGAAGQAGLRAFAFDPQTGSLAPCGAYDGIAAPSFAAVHPSGRWLYAVSETGIDPDGTAGHVHALGIDRAGEGVTFLPLNVQPSGGDLPCHLRVDPSGKWLIVTNYGTGSVGALPIQTDGSLGELSTLVWHAGRGVDPVRQEGPHAHSAIFTPDGAFVIAADLGIDRLMIHRFVDGRLTPTAEVQSTPGAGPRHMAFHPNGRVLYVTNELNGTLSAYNYTAGCMEERQTLSTLPDDPPENLAADLQVTPAGDRVYVSNRGDNSLAVFGATPEGDLRRLTLVNCAGNWPRNIVLAPGGRFILAANQYSGEVVTMPLLPDAGEIGAPAARTAVPDVTCVVFAPELPSGLGSTGG
jgi:6-phosphogluconolactonase